MKFNRKIALSTALCLSLILVLVSVLTACTTPTPTQPTQPTPAAPAAPAAPVKLLFASFFQPTDASIVKCVEWSTELQKRSNGRIVVEWAHAGSLAAAPDLYDRLMEGACDAVMFQPYILQGQFPVSELISLPIRSKKPTSETMTKAIAQMFDKGYYDKEYSQVKRIFQFNPTPSQFFWSKSPLTTVDQFKGRKMRIYGTLQQQVFEALGAVPVTMPTPEVYGALEKGTVEGFAFGYGVLQSFKFNEVVKYATEVNVFIPLMSYIMSNKSYDKLPKDLQEVVDGMLKENLAWSVKTAQALDALEEPGIADLKQRGVKIEEFAPGELDKMDALLGPMWTKLINDNEAKGVPAKKWLADLNTIMKGLGVDRPFLGYKP